MRSSGNMLLDLWYAYLPQIPVFLVWGIALVLAAVFWRRNSRASACAFVAFGLLLLNALAAPLVSQSFGRLLRWLGAMRQEAALIVGLVHASVDALAFGLLIVAIFIGRGKQVHYTWDVD
jgi:hypothetical protein